MDNQENMLRCVLPARGELLIMGQVYFLSKHPKNAAQAWVGLTSRAKRGPSRLYQEEQPPWCNVHSPSFC
jgi:hypothetical protein